MSETLLETAWSKVRDGKALTPKEAEVIRESERAKAVKAGVVLS